MDRQEQFTEQLAKAQQGDRDAANQLWSSVYDEVRRLAKQAVARESGPLSVAPTELAHDVYLRLAGNMELAFESRAHLLATVARAIRRLLVDRARARNAGKRGGDLIRIPLDDALLSLSDSEPELIDLDEALNELEQLNPRQSQLVELRFFAGLTLEEAAEAVGISRRSVANDWALARAWLRRRLSSTS